MATTSNTTTATAPASVKKFGDHVRGKVNNVMGQFGSYMGTGQGPRDYLARYLMGSGGQQQPGAPFRTVDGQTYGRVQDSPNQYPSWYTGPRGQDSLYNLANPPPGGMGSGQPQVPNFNWPAPWSYYSNSVGTGPNNSYREYVRGLAMAQQNPVMYTNPKTGQSHNRNMEQFTNHMYGYGGDFTRPNLGWFNPDGSIKSGFESQVRNNEQSFYDEGIGERMNEYQAGRERRRRQLERNS